MRGMTRWRAFSIAVVVASLVAFLFFAYAGSVTGVACCASGLSGCSAEAAGPVACGVRSIMAGVDAFTDYMYAVVSLLLGQIILLSTFLLRKPR